LKTRFSHIIPAILAAALAVSAAACSAPPPDTTPSVKTAQAQEGGITASVDVVGVLLPNTTQNVSAKLSGAVLSAPGEVGDKVSKGDLLIQIDAHELQAQLDQAKASQENTQNQVDIAKAAVDNASASLSAAQKTLNNTVAQAKSAVDAAKTAVDSAKTAVDSAKSVREATKNQYDVQIQQAQIAVDKAQKDYNTNRQLFAAGLLPQASMDNYTTALNSAKAALNLANAGAETARVSAQASVDSAQAALNTAQANLDKAQLSYNQALSPDAQSSVVAAQGALNSAQKQYESASTSGVAVAGAAIDVINAQLQNANVYAELSGVIVNKNINQGDIATAGAVLMTIADTSALKLRGTIDQTVLPYVKNGEKVTVKCDIYPDRQFDATVTSVGPMSVTTGGVFPIELSMTNPGDLSPGISARASIPITPDSAATHITVPNTALQTGDSQTFVYVVASDSTVSKRTVTTGVKNDTDTEILNGLKAGETVVTANFAGLSDGAKVQVLR